MELMKDVTEGILYRLRDVNLDGPIFAEKVNVLVIFHVCNIDGELKS
jgi:hypothetical protein